MSPRVGVILPFRNESRTIEEAVRSVLSDEAVPLELIAVDDGSTDGGSAQLESIARADHRLRLFRTEGVGIPKALNWGASKTSAPFIARMDGDDISLPGRWTAQLSWLESAAQLGVVGALVEPFADEGPAPDGMRTYVSWLNTLIEPEDHIRDLFVESPLCHPSVMMRREAFEQAGRYVDDDYPEDYGLWLRMVASGFQIAKVPELFLRWRHHDRRATFNDPRYGQSRFYALKARHLAKTLESRDRRLVIWGAGQTGRRFARDLETHGLRAQAFVDIDPKKIGGIARGAPIIDKVALDPKSMYVIAAVGARGARRLIREYLCEHGFNEVSDFRCVS